MEKLNFYTVDQDYVKYLQTAEQSQRGFSRVPNMDYGLSQKPKFLCGIVLQVEGVSYYVPVSSYRQKKPDNFLIYAENGEVVSSLRFNYMFPVPENLVKIRSIADEPDRAYRSLLAQELRYCITNQDKIKHLAERTYKRVLLGKDIGLMINSCDFRLLEERCLSYMRTQSLPEKNVMEKQSVKARLAQLKSVEASVPKPPSCNERDPR